MNKKALNQNISVKKKLKITYDKEIDAMYIYLEKGKYHISKEIGDFIVDFDSKGKLLGIEILDASKVLRENLEFFLRNDLKGEAKRQKNTYNVAFASKKPAYSLLLPIQTG